MNGHEAGDYQRQHRCKWGEQAQDQEGTCDQLADGNAHGQDVRHGVACVLRLQARDASGFANAKQGANTLNDEEAAQCKADKQQTEVDGSALAVLAAQCLFFLSLRCGSGVSIQSHRGSIGVLRWSIKVLR